MNEDTLSRRDVMLKGGVAAAGIGLAGTTLLGTRTARAQSTADDTATLKALLTAERNAIKTYEAGKGVLDAATSADPLYVFKGVITAIALHFRQQHVDHAEKLAAYLTSQGGTDDVGPGKAGIPSDFVGNIKNVVDLATNAEKAAAIAYTEVQKGIGRAENAELAAAIGSVETQHFVVLQLVARGFVVPPDATKNQTADAMASVAARFSPSSFVVSVKGSPSLADTTTLPMYDVTR